MVMASFLGFSQQDAQFTLYPWGQMYFNPGAIGEQNNTLCFSLLFREQYLGYKDVYKEDAANAEYAEPDQTRGEQILFNLDSYIKKLRGGVGLSVIKDKNGYLDNVGIRLGYAYKMNIGGGKLGIGFQVGLLNMQLDGADLRPGQENDPIVEALRQGESYMNLDFNFGLLYKTATWYAGLSATQLATSIRISGEDNIELARQLYAYGGYIYTIPSNPSWTLEPQALIKTDFKTYSFDIMALARYNGLLWFGASYRLNDAVSVFAGTRPFHNSSNIYLKGLDLGFAYGFTASTLGYQKNRSFGDIELMVRYCFDIYKPEVFSGYGSSRHIYKNQY